MKNRLMWRSTFTPTRPPRTGAEVASLPLLVRLIEARRRSCSLRLRSPRLLTKCPRPQPASSRLRLTRQARGSSRQEPGCRRPRCERLKDYRSSFRPRCLWEWSWKSTLLIDLCGDELQELGVVLEVFHDRPLELGHLVRSISIHGVASPAGDEERAMRVESYS
jgi:hypothetical protein